MSGDAGDWVREGTPRDADATWADEQTDYGTAVTPEEWDDYSVEQSVPVAPPQAQPESATPSTEAEADGHPAGEVAVETPEPPQQAEASAETVELGDEADSSWEHRDTAPAEPVADELAATEAEHVAPAEASGVEPATEVDSPEQPVAPVAAPVSGAESVETADLPAAEEPAQDEPAGSDAAQEDPALADESAVEHRVEEPAAAEAAVAPETRNEGDQAGAVAEDAANTAFGDDAFRAPTGGDEPTDRIDDGDDDLDATQVRPVVSAGSAAGVVAGAAVVGAAGLAGAGAASPALPDGLYRHSTDDDTAILAAPGAAGYPDVDEQEAEELRLREQLAAERQARNQRLGVVDTSAENETRDREGFVKLNTDRFFPSLGLFVLRLVTAGIIGIAGYRILMAIPATAEKFQPTIIPEPRLVAWILGFTLGILALLLIIGMLQRLVGFVLLAISAASLALLRWGNFNVFSATWEGFPLIGDKELLLGAIGFLLLSMGGGSWGIDGAFRRSRANARAEKAA